MMETDGRKITFFERSPDDDEDVRKLLNSDNRNDQDDDMYIRLRDLMSDFDGICKILDVRRVSDDIIIDSDIICEIDFKTTCFIHDEGNAWVERRSDGAFISMSKIDVASRISSRTKSSVRDIVYIRCVHDDYGLKGKGLMVVISVASAMGLRVRFV